jgi:hypothetical protein
MWQGKPVWDDPCSWGWITTIYGSATSVQGIEKSGRLKSVRPFQEKDGGAALELLVGFEKAVFSTVIRLDDSAAISDLFKVLDSLHGYSLKEIGDLRVLESPQIIAQKVPADPVNRV